MYFSNQETERLDHRIRQLEENTGVQLVAALVGKCDNYPEIPWKAFAVGAALSAMVLPLLAWFQPGATLGDVRPLLAAGILAAGGIMALLTTVWPAWARCFLDRPRAEAEIRQYAQALFLELDMAALPGRNGVLLLVGLFERQMLILPDVGVAERLTTARLEAVMAALRPLLRRGDRFQALTRGVAALEAQLEEAGFISPGEAPDTFAATLIQRRGEQDD